MVCKITETKTIVTKSIKLSRTKFEKNVFNFTNLQCSMFNFMKVKMTKTYLHELYNKLRRKHNNITIYYSIRISCLNTCCTFLNIIKTKHLLELPTGILIPKL